MSLEHVGTAAAHIPFMFQVKASRSFCPSISMSSRMGTSTSGWDAFSWITAGSWSSKLQVKWQKSQQGVSWVPTPGPPFLDHWSLQTWPGGKSPLFPGTYQLRTESAEEASRGPGVTGAEHPGPWARVKGDGATDLDSRIRPRHTRSKGRESQAPRQAGLSQKAVGK